MKLCLSSLVGNQNVIEVNKHPWQRGTAVCQPIKCTTIKPGPGGRAAVGRPAGWLWGRFGRVAVGPVPANHDQTDDARLADNIVYL